MDRQVTHGGGRGSYGGYLVSIILGREHPFKAIIAHAAVYNWYTQYAADYGAEHRRFGEFWDKPETLSAEFAALRAPGSSIPPPS